MDPEIELTGSVDFAPLSEATLEATDKHEPEAHQEGTDEQHRPATPAVDVDDRGDGEYDIEHVLHRVGDEISAATSKASALEDVDNVVPAPPSAPMSTKCQDLGLTS